LKKAITYRDSGVDIDAGNRAVKLMKGYVRSTFNRQVLGDLGSFGGLFQFDQSQFKQPVLVSSTDGVGTKIKVAIMSGVYDTVGQDLVNHCCNDILVQGARPLFFLDYVAMGVLEPRKIAGIVKGLSIAAKQQGVVLIGGETAEMPGMYLKGDFDLAGTIVGVVEKSKVVTGAGIKPGDVVVNLPSVGLHTNGFSLARKILFDANKFKVNQKIAPLKTTLAEALLKPHKCYAREVLALMKKVPVQGMAHITGGGLDNIPRVLPDNCRVEIKRGTWPVLDVFKLLVEKGRVPEFDAYRTFNMGLGFLLILHPRDAMAALKALAQMKQKAYVVGEVVKGKRGAVLV
jgi:phosphoribosylformylglycinamidine cyclo-ligase